MDRFIQFTSAPAQKTGPAPVRTIARTDASPASSPNAAVSSAMSASSKALRTAGRSSVTVATAPARVSFRHVGSIRSSETEDGGGRRGDRRVEAGGQGEPHRLAGVGRVEDPVVPQVGRAEIGISLAFVLFQHRPGNL